MEIALFGGGCFWCMEAAFENLDGVHSVTPGYSGGHVDNPGYHEVCTGLTGHAEVVKIEFDPTRISFDSLLGLFWKAHNPTTLNRQGADLGTQYRSVIFYTNELQRNLSAQSIHKNQKQYRQPIVTQLLPAETFWPAEEYHQHYFRNHPLDGYCIAVIAPKLAVMQSLPAHKHRTASTH